jgi:thioredoxin reductase/Pyruvate/2-oxoacid:ferredoxin oxidoreductase delta subunit
VTFTASGEALRFRGDAEERGKAAGPAGATVPLVRLSACAGCHDLARAADPVRACVAPGAAAAYAVCFDEHQRAADPLPARGACERQHDAARYVAWEAAREVAAGGVAAPRVTASARRPWLWVGSALAAGVVAFAGVGALQRRRLLRRRGPATGAPAAPSTRLRLPQVDASRCLGCHACVEACPFDVLSVERHVAVVARPDECCGVGACETACPNGSLRLAAEPQPAGDRARVDASFQSADVPGLYLAGDLTGVPLIRNAILQGAKAAESVAASLAGQPRAAGAVDLAVVGAGPAGLSAALRAKELGLTCAVLEQTTLAATLRAFPRGKVVHDAPIDVPLEGVLWLREGTKEELLLHWTRIVRAHRLDVRESHRVTGVAGPPGAFRVTAATPGGERVLHAARVLLAIGRRGTPRRLEAPIAPSAAARVVYALSDARALAGKRVLLVGLGDAAMEAAVALARQPGTIITLCHRGAGFDRGRAHNIDAVRALVTGGRVRLVLRSTVARVDDHRAILQTPAGPEALQVDVVIALLGGEPSRALLEAVGIGVKR